MATNNHLIDNWTKILVFLLLLDDLHEDK